MSRNVEWATDADWSKFEKGTRGLHQRGLKFCRPRQREYSCGINVHGDGDMGFKTLLFAIGAVVGAGLMMFVDHQPWLLASIKYNFSWDGTRDWMGATSGWAAAIVAAPTIYLLWRQLDQVWKAERDRSRGIADTLVIDLQDTGERLPNINQLHDLAPPMSELSRQLIMDATRVAPELAVALQKHCREIGAFESVIRARTGQYPGAIPGALLTDANALAFRSTVLSWCFGVASTQIASTGRATGPYINRSDLERIKQMKGVQDGHTGFLTYLFEVSPLGEN